MDHVPVHRAVCTGNHDFGVGLLLCGGHEGATASKAGTCTKLTPLHCRSCAPQVLFLACMTSLRAALPRVHEASSLPGALAVLSSIGTGSQLASGDSGGATCGDAGEGGGDGGGTGTSGEDGHATTPRDPVMMLGGVDARYVSRFVARAASCLPASCPLLPPCLDTWRPLPCARQDSHRDSSAPLLPCGPARAPAPRLVHQQR